MQRLGMNIVELGDPDGMHVMTRVVYRRDFPIRTNLVRIFDYESSCISHRLRNHLFNFSFCSFSHISTGVLLVCRLFKYITVFAFSHLTRKQI